MTEPSEESSEAPETTDEIKYKDLTTVQKAAADEVLEAYQNIRSWGRQWGRTTVTKYIIQEIKKMDNL